MATDIQVRLFRPIEEWTREDVVAALNKANDPYRWFYPRFFAWSEAEEVDAENAVAQVFIANAALRPVWVANASLPKRKTQKYAHRQEAEQALIDGYPHLFRDRPHFEAAPWFDPRFLHPQASDTRNLHAAGYEAFSAVQGWMQAMHGKRRRPRNQPTATAALPTTTAAPPTTTAAPPTTTMAPPTTTMAPPTTTAVPPAAPTDKTKGTAIKRPSSATADRPAKIP